jgi:hypothetical protein
MSANPRVLARAVSVVVFTLVSAVMINVGPQAMAVTSHKALNDTRAVRSGPVSVSFPMEYFGLVADLKGPSRHLSANGPAPYGEARFHVRGQWTSWQPLDQDGAQADGHFTSALVAVDRGDAYQVRGLPTGGTRWRAAAINTTDGPSVTVAHRRSGAASAAASCRSRADWGADESISGWSTGTATPSYYPLQALTVHHTAGSNDLTQDYSATVRAIYSYHVQTNGWADIGYQYLVDGRGTLYEGRNAGHTSTSCLYGGGDGSDFAHQTGTDDVVNGAHVANYNASNAGIALMGCYEATSACSGNTTPPAAAVDGLENLLASLSSRHHLDPTGTVHYVNPASGAVKDVATISGHRDWEATACPGGNLYTQLPSIRANVASRTAGTPPPTAPGSPTSFSATASGSTASLAWAPPASDGGSAVTSYQLFRGSSTPVSTSSPAVYTGSATSVTDKPSAGTYYYAVRACNAVGCGTTSAAGPVTVVGNAAITSGSCNGASCTFTGTGVSTLRWTFGNGSTATGSPVTGTYVAKGSYTVTLTDRQTPATQASRLVTCSIVKRKLRCST